MVRYLQVPMASDDLDFRRKTAGTYLIAAEANGQPSVRKLLTTTADGCFLSTDTDDFGNGDLTAKGFQSNEYGKWFQVKDELRPRRVELSGLGLAFDAKGAKLGTCRMSYAVDFTDDFGEVSGTFTMDRYTLGQLEDQGQTPCNCNCEPADLKVLEGTLTGRRLCLRSP